MPKKQKIKKEEPVEEPIQPNDQETAEPELVNEPVTETPIKPLGKNPVAATPKVVRADKPKNKPKIPLWVWMLVGLVLIAGAAVGGYLYWSRPETNDNTNTVVNTNTVNGLAPRVVDGVLVSPTKTNPNLFAVMVENIRESRPPSGLDKASVVYEALAEGGITRFLAIIPTSESFPELGPVRSARPYFVDWASEYNKPMYVHCGGSPQALDLLRSAKTTVVDFNQFTHGPYFWRDKTRHAPHNLYISSTKLYLGLKNTAADLSPSFTGWTFADDPALDARPETVKDITVDFSSIAYRVVYTYDRALNVYKRSIGGQPHVTRDGTQLTAKNVVVQFVQTGLYPKETQRLKMTTVGEGKALIFRNGETIVGTWKKTAEQNRTMFYDANGQLVTLTRGNTWVDVLPTDRTVTYE